MSSNKSSHVSVFFFLFLFFFWHAYYSSVNTVPRVITYYFQPNNHQYCSYLILCFYFTNREWKCEKKKILGEFDDTQFTNYEHSCTSMHKRLWN